MLNTRPNIFSCLWITTNPSSHITVIINKRRWSFSLWTTTSRTCPNTFSSLTTFLTIEIAKFISITTIFYAIFFLNIGNRTTSKIIGLTFCKKNIFFAFFTAFFKTTDSKGLFIFRTTQFFFRIPVIIHTTFSNTITINSRTIRRTTFF